MPTPDGSNILDFTEAGDDGWQRHQLDHNYANRLHVTPDRYPHQHLIS